jgi:hypothetical protein
VAETSLCCVTPRGKTFVERQLEEKKELQRSDTLLLECRKLLPHYPTDCVVGKALSGSVLTTERSTPTTCFTF